MKLRAIHLLKILWFCCLRQLDSVLVGGKDGVFWLLGVIREIMTGFKMAGWSPSYPHMRDGHTIIGSYNWVWPSSRVNNLEENSWCRPPSQWVEEWRSPSGQNLNKIWRQNKGLTPFPQHCLRIPAIPRFNFDSILSRQAGARPDQGELEHLPHRRVHHRRRHHRHLHEDRFLRQVLLILILNSRINLSSIHISLWNF